MFIILEAQTYNDGNVGTIVNSYTDKNTAESEYHKVLAAAAISNVPVHTCFMLASNGLVLKSECYKHEVAPESESEE